MKNIWRALFGSRRAEEARDQRRDPDLDLVKHMAEDHEYRLQLMERDLERIAGGSARRTSEDRPERRQGPRH